MEIAHYEKVSFRHNVFLEVVCLRGVRKRLYMGKGLMGNELVTQL